MGVPLPQAWLTHRPRRLLPRALTVLCCGRWLAFAWLNSLRPYVLNSPCRGLIGRW